MLVLNLLFCPSLLPAPISWTLKPMQFSSMMSSLSLWILKYERSSVEYECSLEMIEWYKRKDEDVSHKGCVGMYHVHDLRAIAQFYQPRDSEQIILRSLITPRDEIIAGTIMLYKVINTDDFDVDLYALQKNPRWFVAANFMLQNASFFSL